MCGIATMRAATARAPSMSPILRMRLRPLVQISGSMRMGIVMFDRYLRGRCHARGHLRWHCAV